MTNEMLGKRLRTLRKHYGYTQNYIASKLNVTRQAYGNYESGIRALSLQALETVAGIYQVSLDILTDPDIPLPPDNPQTNDSILRDSGSYRAALSSPYNMPAGLTGQEAGLLRDFRSLPPALQTEVIQFIRFKKSQTGSAGE